MSAPISFYIDESKKLYYNSKDLLSYNKDFFINCTAKPRNVIVKRKIPNAEYVYANHIKKTNEWKITDEKSKKAQLLIGKEWIDKHSSFIEKNNRPIIEEKKEIKEKRVYEDAPSIIELEEHEKFRDGDGNIINIETRGERTRKNIYFRVKDVAEAFDIPTLRKNLTDPSINTYEYEEHYKIFIRNDAGSSGITNKKQNLFLTWTGILQVIFSSRSKTARKYQVWAEQKLFTIQMGSKEEKQQLGTSLLGIDVKTFKNVMKKYASNFPCIYLIALGTVKELRRTFNISNDISDDKIVYKYGYTDNMDTRLDGHKSKFKLDYSIRDINISLFHMIDTEYLSQAETSLNYMFSSINKKFEHTSETELVILDPKKDLQYVKEQYQFYGKLYAGMTRSLQVVIDNLRNEIENQKIKHNSELELQKIKYEKELIEKELEFSKKLIEEMKSFYLRK